MGNLTPSVRLVMGIRLLKGRLFTEDDNRPEAPPRVVINETLARQFFPGRDPLGRRLQSDGRIWEVVGVVGDIRQERWEYTLPGRTYFPQCFQPWVSSVVVRAQGAPEMLVAAMRETIRRVDPDQAVANVHPLQLDLERSLVPQRMTVILVGVFAVAALALACLGIYGVMAYTIEQRQRELCIRLALGALRADILKMVLQDGLRLGAAGVALGLAGGLAGARLLADQLFEVPPLDPVVFAGAVIVLGGVLFLSILVPARRATRNDALAALRAE